MKQTTGAAKIQPGIFPTPGKQALATKGLGSSDFSDFVKSSPHFRKYASFTNQYFPLMVLYAPSPYLGGKNYHLTAHRETLDSNARQAYLDERTVTRQTT